MIHTADLWRPSMIQRTSQDIEDYDLLNPSVPCFIQPYATTEQFYYEQRGFEGKTTIYTTSLDTFQRNDIMQDDRGNQFHVVGVANANYMDLYQQLDVLVYPEGAKKRLSREAYP